MGVPGGFRVTFFLRMGKGWLQEVLALRFFLGMGNICSRRFSCYVFFYRWAGGYRKFSRYAFFYGWVRGVTGGFSVTFFLQLGKGVYRRF